MSPEPALQLLQISLSFCRSEFVLMAGRGSRRYLLYQWPRVRGMPDESLNDITPKIPSYLSQHPDQLLNR